jgi:hypothetical protein
MILKNWYLEMEMHRETTSWDTLVQWFKVNFTFKNESPSINTMLQVIRTNIFLDEWMMEVVLSHELVRVLWVCGFYLSL